jgi:hypothetical protein
MDSENNKFWITFWKIAATTLIAVILIGGGCATTERVLISKAIESGTNPIAARCAIAGFGQSDNAICAIVTNNKDK